jgi:hypothetical protein
MTFDVWKQSSLMNGLSKMQAVPTQAPIDNLDDLKRLAGINTSMGEEMSEQGTNLGQIQRERNIQPGTDEWFRLWFALPKLTGETPYDK